MTLTCDKCGEVVSGPVKVSVEAAMERHKEKKHKGKPVVS